MHKILIGAPVRQEPTILREFLRSLSELDKTGLQVEFAFVDDNVDEDSREHLRRFAEAEPTTLMPGEELASDYAKDEFGHVWSDELIWKVARYKDRILDHARAHGHDAVFLIDSDLVLHPATLRHLVGCGVDVVSEVFWTRWYPYLPDRPQVWLRDQYTMHEQRRDEQLSQDEIDRRKQEFFKKLLQPGLYEVGGLGACTLISRRALLAGVGFQPISNLSFVGEDRHFCVRAVVLGLKLHADTHYPPLHVYRLSELSRVDGFRASTAQQQRRVEALQTVRDVVAAWGNTHYDSLRGDEGLQWFGAALRADLGASAAKRAADARASRAVVRSHVVSLSQRDLPDGGVAVAGTLVREGSTGGVPFRDDLGLIATLRDEGDGHQRVTELQLHRLAEPLVLPATRKTHGNRVLLSMLVKNEAGRHLEKVLSHAASYVDEVLIVDDGSTDDSVAVCARVLRDVPHTIVQLGDSTFHDEHRLRRRQWELARSRCPDWILCLDADEQFEERMPQAIRALVDQDQYDAIAFRLYDFWDERCFRDDPLWSAHRTFRPFLVRALPGIGDEFRQSAQHCGRWPLDVGRLRTATSELRLKHLGWARPEDRQAKYERYRLLDPQARHGSAAQYESILEPNPNLVCWQE